MLYIVSDWVIHYTYMMSLALHMWLGNCWCEHAHSFVGVCIYCVFVCVVYHSLLVLLCPKLKGKWEYYNSDISINRNKCKLCMHTWSEINMHVYTALAVTIMLCSSLFKSSINEHVSIKFLLWYIHSPDYDLSLCCTMHGYTRMISLYVVQCMVTQECITSVAQDTNAQPHMPARLSVAQHRPAVIIQQQHLYGEVVMQCILIV